MDILALLQSYQQICGVIVGSALTAAVSFAMRSLDDRRARRDARREQYLLAIDSAHELRHALNRVMQNAQEQYRAAMANPPRTEDAKRLDAEGARLIEDLIESQRSFELIGSHLRVFGAQKVAAAHAAVEKNVNDFLYEALQGMLTSGRIRYSNYKKEQRALLGLLDNLISEMQHDLEYRRGPRWQDEGKAPASDREFAR